VNVGNAFNRPAFLLLLWLSFVSFEKWATQDVVLEFLLLCGLRWVWWSIVGKISQWFGILLLVGYLEKTFDLGYAAI